MVKYKNKLEFLRQKQNWWDKLSSSVQNATTRPGSVKTR